MTLLFAEVSLLNRRFLELFTENPEEERLGAARRIIAELEGQP